MTVTVVTDLGFGDSGKGTTVDYLSRQGPTVVVRHNGGPQAGHNVVTTDGRHHEFAQFGSGTFAGAKTFLSKYMLVNPLNMDREAEHLIGLGEADIFDRTFVDARARVITPFHVALNRLRETARGDDRHGSCGQGVGEAVSQDIDRPDLTVRAGDLKDLSWEDLRWKLTMLRTVLAHDHPQFNDDSPDWFILYDYDIAGNLARRYKDWARQVRVVDGAQWLGTQDDHSLVFEGAQGVLLDETHGFHPYTTWSNTTHDNALALLNELDYFEPGHDVTRLGVTRAYMTRHGAGPFPTEDELLHFPEPHNRHGLWQGAFRRGQLDLGLLAYAVQSCKGIDGIVVNHLDQATWWGYCDVNEDWHHCGPEDLLEKVSEALGAPIHLTSHGPTAADKKARVLA